MACTLAISPERAKVTSHRLGFKGTEGHYSSAHAPNLPREGFTPFFA